MFALKNLLKEAFSVLNQRSILLIAILSGEVAELNSIPREIILRQSQLPVELGVWLIKKFENFSIWVKILFFLLLFFCLLRRRLFLL